MSGPTEYRKPPSTGPTIAEPVNVAVQSAITCGNSACSTMSGGIDRRAGDSIASDAPSTNAIANSGHTAPGCDAL